MFSNHKIYQAEGISVKQSLLHGQGVFALNSFNRGDIIETAPVILLNKEEKDFLQTTTLFNYYFLVNNIETPVAFGLGYCSLYNHSYTANANYSINLKKKAIVIKAHKSIKPGEEITINYNGFPENTTPVYFQTD